MGNNYFIINIQNMQNGIKLVNQALTPITPDGGETQIYINSNKRIGTVDENGLVKEYLASTSIANGISKLTGQYYINDSGKAIQSLKIHNHLNTSSIGGAEFKTDTENTSGLYFGVYNEGILNKTGTASITTGIDRSVVGASATITGGTIIGNNGQVQILGTVAGSSFVAAGYYLIEASTAITASHVCSIWADSHMANAVTGNHELIYGSNNGVTSLDQVMYFSGQAEALLHLNTAGGPSLNYVSDTAETSGASKKIKILIEGSPFYINAYAGA